MHPNKLFHWTDDEAMRAFIGERAFAHVFVATHEPAVFHVPLTLSPKGFRFHIARSNRAASNLDGATVLASISARDFYVSPDWYHKSTDQVPTWNYVSVEVEGVARALSQADLLEQIETLSKTHEAVLLPKPMWRRDKVGAERLHAMYPAIEAFEIDVTAMRGTRKLSQNKSADDREGVSSALRSLGKIEDADALV